MYALVGEQFALSNAMRKSLRSGFEIFSSAEVAITSKKCLIPKSASLCSVPNI
jgi:hypothetical protein